MKKLFVVFFLLWMATPVAALECPDGAVQEKGKAELLKIHEEDRGAHFGTNANALISRAPDVFISVSRGKVQNIKKEEEREFFEKYFKNAKYHEWDNLEPPIVRVSCDGTMGWTIVRVKVRREQAGADGKLAEQRFVYAGIMTYEKQNGKWIRIANVSTFE